MPESEKTSSQVNTDDSNRQQWISEAAYFIAEATGFEQGKDLEHWLKAEIEYSELQIKSFVLRSHEDGGVTVYRLQEFAKSMGVPGPFQMRSKAELIRKIQEATHHRPCFQSAYQQPCPEIQAECVWREECQKLIVIWQRSLLF